MQFISSIRKKILLTILSMPFAAVLIAQHAAKTVVETLPGNNQLAMLLAIMTVILAFVIWGMGRVLIELGRQVLDKQKNTSKALNIVLLTGFSLLAQVSFAQDATKAATEQLVVNYGGLSKTSFEIFITVIGVEVITILFFAFSIKRMYAELLPEKPKRVVATSPLRNWWLKLDSKLFTRAIPVEKEADVLLDHNYDGIRELDNALPPWWKYGFYLTIVVAVIYLLNFHVFGLGKNPDEEYVAEMVKAKIEKEIYESQHKDKVDENNVPMADAAGIKAGMDMFEANCVACHVKGGAGNVGPNLTDDYWIHKGSLNDIYKSIKMGYTDKGMQSWSSKFTDKEISILASYIKSIRGTNPPNSKLPQGDLFTDVISRVVSSKAIKTDTTAIKKQ